MPRFDLPEPVTLVVICMATLLSGVVNTATGVGGSAMLLPIALLFLTPQESLVVVAISQVTRNLYLTLLVYREAVWRVTWRLMVGGALGAVLGASLVGAMPELLLRRTLALGLLVYVVTELYSAKPKWEVPLDMVPAVGFLTGSLSGLFGSTGPIAAPFLFRHGLTGIHLVATLTAAAAVMNFAKLATYWARGFFHGIPEPLAWGTVGSVAVGVQIGVWILRGSSLQRFRMLFLGMLTLVALTYLFGAVKENPAAAEARLQAQMRQKFLESHQ